MPFTISTQTPPSKGCQTLFQGFYLQVKHKYSVPHSERCQTPFEGFYLQVKHKYSVPPSENLLHIDIVPVRRILWGIYTQKLNDDFYLSINI